MELREIKEAIEKIDRASYPVYFDELLDLAQDIMLKEPLPPVAEEAPATPNTQIIEKFGVLGLRSAYELYTDNEFLLDIAASYPTAPEEQGGNRPILVDSPMRIADKFSDGYDLNTVRRVEQFGKRIIEESYSLLGDEADKNVELFKTGTEENERAAISWLTDKIKSLTETSSGEPAENGEYDYNPLRLSPKYIEALGVEKLPPTCLGVSIIASSFFEKAGADYLHAGVMKSGYESQKIATTHALLGLVERLEADPAMSDMVDRVLDKAREIYRDAVKNRGYHAAVYYKGHGDMWNIYDVNYDSIGGNSQTVSDAVEDVYKILDFHKHDAPSLEMSAHTDYVTIQSIVLRVLDAGPDTFGFTPGQIASVAKDIYNHVGPREELAKKVLDDYLVPMIKKLMKDDNFSRFKPIIKHFIYTDYGLELLLNATKLTIDRQVLHGEKDDELHERLASDREYSARRLEDIRHIPAYFAANVAMCELSEPVLWSAHHAAVEFGRPHSRVGFAVLNDVAVNYGSELTPSFWLNNWGSLVPTTEHLGREVHTDEERDRRHKMLMWHFSRSLNYIKNDAIIEKYLIDTKEKSPEED
ncbi:hypothetical protein KC949_00945 [Candidatus Saccharibacteria bacterium]|nr:hypothetical protein [Candidatus Saccharibacteria bacterium]